MASENLTIPHFSLSRPLTVSEGYDLPRSPDLESKIVPDPRGGAINSIHVTGPHVRAGLLLPIFDQNMTERFDFIESSNILRVSLKFKCQVYDFVLTFWIFK